MNNASRHCFIGLIIFCFSLPSLAIPDTLWYEKSAQHWEEALPLGNGRLGAMVYGDVVSDNIQLNENNIYHNIHTADLT